MKSALGSVKGICFYQENQGLMKCLIENNVYTIHCQTIIITPHKAEIFNHKENLKSLCCIILYVQEAMSIYIEWVTYQNWTRQWTKLHTFIYGKRYWIIEEIPLCHSLDKCQVMTQENDIMTKRNVLVIPWSRRLLLSLTKYIDKTDFQVTVWPWSHVFLGDSIQK